MTEQDVTEELDLSGLEPHTDVLRATDRCDKCGVQAYYRVEFGSGSCLDFCRRCFLQREAALMAAARDVINETHKLNKFIPQEPDGQGKGNR